MRKISAREASKSFGQLMDDAQLEPVTVEKNGQPKVVIYSYEEAQRIEAMKDAQFEAFIQEGIKAADEGRVQPLTKELMDQLVADGISGAKERK